MEKFCKEGDIYPEAGAVLTCLREIKDDLSSACKEEVFRTQVSPVSDGRSGRGCRGSCNPLPFLQPPPPPLPFCHVSPSLVP